jgi:hypothetical protein
MALSENLEVAMRRAELHARERQTEAAERTADAIERLATMFEQVFAGTVAGDIEEGDEPEPVSSWNSGKR